MEKLTVEDRIMGRKEPLPPTELQLKAFSAETKYKVNSIGKDNPSIMVGSFVDRILPLEIKQQIKNGEIVVEYNGLKIERIVEEQPTVKENLTVEEEQPPKPKRKRAK
jgi:hypothetical protein